ncbi:Nitrilase family, member 2 [Seminavis robusta]|uniref:Nitrilase family, member 2 n=1 Tax=Seminavis robusta TaxID=568900 RepID=A0A9N8ECS2_9STRA|nr:Nitrilase family, member 2 [Seminavis robusta]|eukprot:Sro984_g227940.1 Nitrilase family, member 2 (217) ;mRNA; r:34493-35143
MVLSNTAIVLPADFIPTEHTIIIGRGRVVKQHSANKKFDKMIQAIAADYQAAPCKSEKGAILTRLIHEIGSAADIAGFVRKDPTTGHWTLVEEALARQTAAQAMRNALSHSYRSSKQFKSKRRMQQIAQQQQQQQLTMTVQVPPRCVSPSESSISSQESYCSYSSSNTYEATDDTLSLLLAAFGNNVSNQTENPFEPTPIIDCLEFDCFEPIPLAL